MDDRPPTYQNLAATAGGGGKMRRGRGKKGLSYMDKYNMTLFERHPVTKLMIAASKGNFEEAKTLIDKGASVKATDTSDTSVLMYAAMGGNLELVKLLIDLGCDAEHVDDSELTTLMYAAMGGNLEIVKLLVERGADFLAWDGDHVDARGHARQHEEDPGTHKQHKEIIKYLNEKIRRAQEEIRREHDDMALWRLQ